MSRQTSGTKTCVQLWMSYIEKCHYFFLLVAAHFPSPSPHSHLVVALDFSVA